MPALIILRGLPGSGKSTLARVLSDDKWPVYAIDDYFTDPETQAYTFKFDENHLAYKHCETRSRQAMQDGVEKIILDNTFTLNWEIAPYFQLAAEYNYTVFVMTVENYHGSHNQHGISAAQLQKMAEKYKVRLM